MDSGSDLIAIVLIWGTLIFLLIQASPIISHDNNGNFLASVVSSFKNYLDVEKEIKGIISEAVIHFNKKINIFDIKVSLNNSDLIFAASDYGLFISRDKGLNWQSFSDKENKISAKTEVYKILLKPHCGFISVFQDGKRIVYQSQDNFSSLRKVLEFDDTAINDFDIFENNFYAGLSDGRLIVYSLENQSFRVLTKFDSAISVLKVPAHDLIYLTLRTTGFYVSKNNGQSFERMEFLDDFRGANKIFDFLVDFKNDFSIYAATDYGLIRSQDSGLTWQVFKSLPIEKQKISILARPVGNNKEIFAADYDKIYRSRDEGRNWQILYPEIEDGRKISAMAVDGERIIVGSKD